MPRLSTLVSVAVHAAVITILLTMQTLSPGMLPTPRDVLALEAPEFIEIVPAPPPIRRAPPRDEQSVSRNAAPLVPPRSIADETGFENGNVRSTGPGAVAGVERGDASLGVVGIVENVPPPLQPAAPPTPVRLHSGMQAPHKIVDVRPAYPPIAQTARIEGVVILETVIDTRGNVESVHVLRSIPMLDQAAIDAVRLWKFTPSRLNGEPVPIVMTVTVNFSLK
jgi:protein TonB